MATVLAADVAKFLGKGDDTKIVALAAEHLPIVTAFVRAYVRGNGFTTLGDPAQDLAYVIVSACARLTYNPEMSTRYQASDYSEALATLNGFTLPELFILNSYRKRAA